MRAPPPRDGKGRVLATPGLPNVNPAARRSSKPTQTIGKLLPAGGSFKESARDSSHFAAP
jgi:hypothetical protein